MGGFKKEAARKERQGKQDGMSNVRTKGENFYRDAKKIKTLNLRDGKEQRNSQGKITQAAPYQSRDKPNARIEPNRKWFGNSRVIAQDSLTGFREAIEKQSRDPYSVLLRSNKLPLSLIRDAKDKNGNVVAEKRPLTETFGPKSHRKRVKLSASSVSDLAGQSEKMHDEYLDRREQAQLLSGTAQDASRDVEESEEDDGALAVAKESIFSKGTSRRIFNELYKTLDASDVICEVLDARDPIGTRCHHVEKFLKEEAPHKHVILLLNKCDLVPTSVAASWVRALSKERPTLAFHASITNSFGKGSLIQVLRQFSALHSNRKQISVSFIGYPNVGKSSIINTLRSKKVAKTAPVPGETRVWQYIKLMKRILCIDCPGIVPPSQHDSDEDILLRGAIRVEAVSNPEQYVAAALRKCKQRHVEKTYDIKSYTSTIDFLDQLARKSGKMLKGGESDVNTVARTVLNDFLRGKIPWFIPPSGMEEKAANRKGEDGGRTGDVALLNKMPTAELRSRKRKRDDVEDREEDVNGPEGANDAHESASSDSGAESIAESDEESGFDGESDGQGAEAEQDDLNEDGDSDESDASKSNGGATVEKQ
ncbi:MAG: GTPase required for pre-60S ribosomal subunit nuclear export and maturation [Chrysothrix sp. TS-e1954]|nr:MAG: GTPase required for pre-60S ribosomal subunit nuclear export and maturation [Chrysothrix sp. TS-e1954]